MDSLEKFLDLHPDIASRLSLDEELDTLMSIELARELIMAKEGSVDEVLFARTIEKIVGENGTHNAFDAPILYTLLRFKDQL